MQEVFDELERLFPDITWAVYEPSQETQTMFGPGIMLRGRKDGKEKEFLLLDKDTDGNRFKWGIVIAHNLGCGNNVKVI